MGARVRLPDDLQKLLRSELEVAIRESALSREDALIATRYIVEKVPQIDIAVELGWERSTISKRLPNITRRVAWAAARLEKITERHITPTWIPPKRGIFLRQYTRGDLHGRYQQTFKSWHSSRLRR